MNASDAHVAALARVRGALQHIRREVQVYGMNADTQYVGSIH